MKIKELIIIIALIGFGYKIFIDKKVEINEYLASFKSSPWEKKIHAHYSSGKVILLRGEDYYEVKKNDTFELGDKIFTGKDGYLVLKFGHQSQLKLFENSNLEINNLLLKKQDYSGKYFTFNLKIGSVFFNGRKGKGQTLLLSGTSKVLVTGTQFVLNRNNAGSSRLAVLYGTVDLDSNSSPKVTVGANNGTIISNNGVPMPASNYRWVEKLDWERASKYTDVLMLKEKVKILKGVEEKKDFLAIKGENKKIKAFLDKYGKKGVDLGKEIYEKLKIKPKVNKEGKVSKIMKDLQGIKENMKRRKELLESLSQGE